MHGWARADRHAPFPESMQGVSAAFQDAVRLCLGALENEVKKEVIPRLFCCVCNNSNSIIYEFVLFIPQQRT